MPDIEKIHKSLQEHKISESFINQIMDGKKEKYSKKNEKASFITLIINRIDNLFDSETCKQIIDWCACCKGGSREKDIKKFVKENKEKSLAEKIEGLSKVQNMGNPKLNEDGTISTGIFWGDENGYKCPCPCFNGVELKEPVSITYCYCCAGHFRYHYQNALGLKLKTKEVVSSVLNSLGKKPCQFVYEIDNKQEICG